MARIRPAQIKQGGASTNDVLTWDGTDWGPAASSGGGGSGVSTFNTRTGAVTLSKADVTGTGLAASDVGAQPSDSDLTAIAALTTTSFGRSLLALADASAGRTALGLGTAATQAATAFDTAGAAAAVQSASQPLDSDLTAIAALTTTSYGRSVLAVADATALRTLAALGTVATHAATEFSTSLTRTVVKTANYTAVAGDLVPVDTTSGAVTVTLPNAPAVGTHVAVKLIIVGGSNAVTIACAGSDVLNKAGGSTSATLTLLNHAAVFQYDTGGIWTVVAVDLPKSSLDTLYQPLDAELTALAGLTSAADRVPYFTGSGTAAVAVQTSFARTLLDDTDAATARATLGLGSVDNTADTAKPVSTAQQTALDAKLPTVALSPVPTGILAQTIRREEVTNAAVASGTTGVVRATLTWLKAGTSVTSIKTWTGGTGAGTPTHAYFIILDTGGVVKAVTSDALTAAWAATTAKTLNITSGPWVVPTDGWYYVGCSISATTMPTLYGPASLAVGGPHSEAPFLAATFGTQATPPSVGATLAATSAAVRVYHELL